MIDFMNEKVGELNKIDGVDCHICLNRGYIYYTDDGYEILSRKCECMKKRNIQRTINSSGLKDNFERYQMDNFETKESFQKHIKELALDFVNNHRKQNAVENYIESWFYIAGQVGSGKSHICTAISSELINQGYNFKYLDFAHDMSRLTNELRSGYVDVREKAEREFETLTNVKILYIDDFLKTNDDRHVFDLINSRYGKNDLITIISSERIFDKNEVGLEGLPSRIYERAGKYYITINKDTNKNWRVK